MQIYRQQVQYKEEGSVEQGREGSSGVRKEVVQETTQQEEKEEEELKPDESESQLPSTKKPGDAQADGDIVSTPACASTSTPTWTTYEDVYEKLELPQSWTQSVKPHPDHHTVYQNNRKEEKKKKSTRRRSVPTQSRRVAGKTKR